MAIGLTFVFIATFIFTPVARAQPSDFKMTQPSSPAGVDPRPQAGAAREADAAQTPSGSAASLELDAQPGGSTYRSVVAAAVAEHRAGHWLEARALFLRAHELEPSARTLRVLGMTAFELREYPDAVRELSAALLDARHPLSGAQRRQVQELLERANMFVGRYRLRLDPPHTRVQLNGMDVALEPDGTLLLPLGRQALAARASGHATMRREVVVDGHDGRTLRFQLEPRWWASGNLPPLSLEPADHGTHAPNPWLAQEARPPRRWQRPALLWTFLSGGAAASLSVTSFALRRRALREDDALREQCMGRCDPSEDVTRTRDGLQRWSVATLGASLVLAASSVAIYFIEARAARSKP